jgi:DNA topoisomerase-1
LYDLIWKRAIASQMSSAQLEKTVVTISAAPTNEKFEAKAETVQFDGFLKVYIEGRDEEENEDEAILPPLKIGQNLQRKDLSAVQTFSRPKPRYTEASLVRRLEEMGIGRPSTYAPTISTIQDRGYVEKTDVPGVERTTIKLFVNDKVEREEITERTPEDRGKLVPTPIGTLVTDFLVKHFPEVVDYNFTAKAEDEFDEIAEGKKQWNKMIADFYKPFHQTVEDAADISRTEASGARELGKDPKTGKPVIVRMGRFGPMVQIGQAEDEEKPQFAAVPPGQKMEDLTLDEALELFALPRKVAVTPEGEEVMANFGRFGPYIKFGNLFVSIKPDDPFNISSERALELVTEKKQAEAQKNIKEFPGTTIKVLNGRYGPYVTDGKTNARIPKGQEPAAITQEQATEMLKESASKPKRRGRR